MLREAFGDCSLIFQHVEPLWYANKQFNKNTSKTKKDMGQRGWRERNKSSGGFKASVVRIGGMLQYIADISEDKI